MVVRMYRADRICDFVSYNKSSASRKLTFERLAAIPAVSIGTLYSFCHPVLIFNYLVSV